MLRIVCWNAAWMLCVGVLTLTVVEPLWAVIRPGITVGITDVVQLPNTQNSRSEDNRVDDGFTRINFMKPLDDAERWLINDLRGEVYMWNGTTAEQNLYLDFKDVGLSRFITGPRGLSTGLINVTPHPDFSSNGKFYSIHEELVNNRSPAADFVAIGNPGNIEEGQQAVIMEWTANDPASTVFEGTSRELMRIAQPAGNLHAAGDIFFHPNDGLMYIAMGDQGYDSARRGSPQVQSLESIFGKIVRIDPFGNNSDNGAYGIPEDNPFHDGDGANLDEIWALGFRNPHRLQYDPVTEVFTTTEIGEGYAEEINILEAGANYGWGPNDAWYEGNRRRGGGRINSIPAEMTFPAAQYRHSELPGDFEAIAGGFVYRGSLIPELVGKFVYGDIISGQILYSDIDEMMSAHQAQDLSTANVYSLSLTQDDEPVTMRDLVIDGRNLGETSLPNSGRVDMRFAQSLEGEIFVLSKYDGFIRQLGVPVPCNVGSGDIDGNGQVEFADFLILSANFGTTADASQGDIDCSGEVDFADFLILSENFGQDLAATAQVPEPCSQMVFLFGMLALMGLRRSKAIACMSV